MKKRLALGLVAALGSFAFASLAVAQDNADIAPKFRQGITPEQYHQLRDGYVSLLRGLPADPALRQEAVQTRNRQLAAASQAGPLVFNPGSWNAIGPNPIPNGQVTGALAVSGRVTSFAIDPTNTNKVYMGTAQGGVYRSVDGGANWTPIFDTGASSAVGAVALAPSNPSILYIGTGEANGSGDSYAGVGMYRVDNADTTATLVGPINPVRNYNNASNVAVSAPVFQGRSISSIIVHPTDPSIVFAGIAGGVIGIGGDVPFGGTIPPLGMRGLVRLTNATSAPASVVAQKLTVTLAASGFDNPNTGNRNVNSMFMDPADPNILTVWINGTTTAGDGGVFQSTDALSANPTFTQKLVTATSGARAEFAGYKESASPTVIYVATGESTNGRIRRSVDGGATWSAALAGGGGFCGGQCFYNIGFDVRPGATTATTDDIVLIGGNTPGALPTGSRLFGKSTDGGASFIESSAGLHADTHFIRMDPTNTNVIWHGNDGGVFKSTNGGGTWASLNSSQINTVQMSGLAVHPTIEKWAIGGTQDNGTNMRRGDGTWFRVDFGDGGYALIDRNATDETNITLYHTYFNQTNNLIGFGRVLSSACAIEGNWAFKGRYGGALDPTPNCDGSDTFNGIALTDAVLFYAPMELGPGNPNTVYFGAGAVYRSTDKGETMPAVSQSSGSPVSTIAVSPQDDNYRIFGRVNGTIFYTTTGANPMTALPAGIPAKYVARAKFDPSNKNTAYIALGGYFGGTASTQSHVWKITNLNTTPVITAINNGLPDVPVNTFAVDPVEGNNLFAGTDIGVYGSTDGGLTWMPYGTDLPVVAVFGMDIQPTSRTLRIGTHGRGVWKIGLPPLPDLTIAKSHTGNLFQGQVGATYSVTVTNTGAGDKPDTALVSVTDVPPSGLSVTAMSGIGWTCTALPTCTRTDLLAPNASYPPILVTVTVAGNASSPQINSVSVTSSAGESNTGNNSANDSAVILVPPDLTITKTHVGNFSQGQTGATYTITVTNAGAGATLAATQVTVTDTPPSGLAITAMSGPGWTCSILPTCTRSDLLAASANYPPITVTVTVAANASSPQSNGATVSIAQFESNTGNNSAADSTVILVPPDLTVALSHAGNFSQGQTGVTFTATVTNSGSGDKLAGASVSLVDTAPAGLTITAMSGTGWTCTAPPTCTRSDPLTAGSSYPPITITASVATNATSPLINSVNVTTAAFESNGGNNSANDSTIILVPPDLTVTKSHTGSFSQGQVGATYTVTVTNSGAGSKLAGDSVSLVDTVPSGLTITAMSGAGWTCTTLPTCTRSDVLAAGASYAAIIVTVNVAANASSPLVNSAAVATPAFESNSANNTANDSTVVLVPPDMTVTKTHVGNFSQGQTGATYMVTVSNSGLGSKLAADGVTVTDTSPSGVTITAMSGSGWTCATLPTCTRSDVLIASASYPPITVTVSVAANATSPKVNSVAVSTTALESNGGNNTAADSTVILVPPDLTISKSHTGNLLQGQTGVTYTALVTNLGAGDKPAGSVVTVTDAPPPGLTITAMSGVGWTCTTLPTCTRSDALGAGFSYPSVTITANVSGNAPSPLVNSIAVSTTAFESNTANNTATDSATVITAPDLTVNKSHVGNFSLGQIGAKYTVVVTNSGVGDKAAGSVVTLTDTVPGGLTITAISGAGWTCATLTTCTRSDALASGVSYPPVTVTVNVGAAATSPQVNAVSVSTAATESNALNNLGTDSTIIVAGTQGSLTVTKLGSASSSGTVTSQDGGINCGATCTATYVNGSNLLLTATPGTGSVFTGWLGPCTGTGACSVAINGAATVSATFALASIGTRILDIDANSAYLPESDGVLILRYLLGMRGSALTSGALGSGPNRTGDPQLSAYLLDILPLLDVDGNGAVDALTDGLMIVRKLMGLTGAAITSNAIGTGATRTTAEIEAYIQTLKPP